MADFLTTKQIQDILRVDRTTIYRLVESGRLPASRVGKQWRFTRADVDSLLQKTTPPPSSVNLMNEPIEMLPLRSAQQIQDAFAEILGVTMVITTMEGKPVTQVSNACGLYAAVVESPEGVSHCIQSWQKLAGKMAVQPKFSVNELGLLCTRGLIRVGNELKGMVFAGGIALTSWPPSAAEIKKLAPSLGLTAREMEANVNAVHHLNHAEQERVPEIVQRVADIFSHLLEDRQLLHGRLRAIASLTVV